MMVKMTGPLRVHPDNRRYFTDDTGKAIYFSGSHTWHVMQDGSEGPFDYEEYLAFMEKNNFNFMRFWTQEGAKDFSRESRKLVFYEPAPYERTGPGNALDGNPKYDLTRFNQEYFDRLRSRLIQAGDYGIYAAVMLFQGWGIEKKGHHDRDPWSGHAFNIRNNTNEIDGDPCGSGEGSVLHTLKIPEITALQKAYINKVIDTVNDLDNIMFEIGNESGNYAADWQYEMISHIKAYENGKPKKHPVLMTYFFPEGNNSVLFNSTADAISPGGPGIDNEWNLRPPASDGRKVILLDTDHIGGIWGCASWVWKCFARGLHPVFMDDMKAADWKTPVYEAMSDTRMFAERMELAGMLPSEYISSTGYCIAKPGSELLVYQPEVSPFLLRMNGMLGTYEVEWFNPGTRKIIKGDSVQGGEALYFTPPFRGDSVLYLKKKV